MIQVAIVADDSRYLRWLGDQLDGKRGASCQLAATSWAAFFEMLDLQQPPHVVLFETGREHRELAEQVKKLDKLLPEARVMAISPVLDLNLLLKFLYAGVDALSIRGEDAEELILAIRALHFQGAYLHPACCVELFQHLRSTTDSGESSSSMLTAEPFQQLSFREKQVVIALSKGLEYKEIASSFNVSLNTVRHHVKSIYRKLGIQRKAELLKLLRDFQSPSH